VVDHSLKKLVTHQIFFYKLFFVSNSFIKHIGICFKKHYALRHIQINEE
jgi:hypothetical protein